MHAEDNGSRSILPSPRPGRPLIRPYRHPRRPRGVARQRRDAGSDTGRATGSGRQEAASAGRRRAAGRPTAAPRSCRAHEHRPSTRRATGRDLAAQTRPSAWVTRAAISGVVPGCEADDGSAFGVSTPECTPVKAACKKCQYYKDLLHAFVSLPLRQLTI
jgi:hypothetical protein